MLTTTRLDERRAQEVRAIRDFLDRYWEFRASSKQPDGLGEDPAQRFIDALLSRGIDLGIRIASKDLEEPPPPDPQVSMAREVQAIKASLREDWEIEVAPKDYASFKEEHGDDLLFDFEKKLEFDGLHLHPDIADCCLAFPDHLRPDQVLFADAQGSPPLDTLIEAIVRQGINLALFFVDTVLDALWASKN